MAHSIGLDGVDAAEDTVFGARRSSHLCLELPTKDGSKKSLASVPSDAQDLLLRGTSPATLLYKGSFFFKSQNGSDIVDVSHLSRDVDELAEFVSHSWHSPRWQKFISLTLHYNAGPAIVCSFLSAVASMIIFAFGGLPPQKTTVHTVTRKSYDWGIWCCFVIGPVVSMTVLLKWQCACEFLGIQNKFVFFDRVCIDQVDQGKKKRGIRSLGAFVAHSRRMVILWSPEYLTRLWCVFELAVLNHLTENEPNRLSLKFIPLPLAPAIVGLLIGVQYVAMVVEIGLLTQDPRFDKVGEEYFISQIPYFLCLFMGLTSTGTFLRRLARRFLKDRHNILSQLDKFSIDQAQCFLADDRKLIIKSVAEMFGDGNAEVGKSKFEAAVRGSFKDRTEAAIGDHIPYSILLFTCSPLAWAEMDFICGYMRSGFDVAVILSECIMGVGFVTLFCPSAYLIMLNLANWMPNRCELLIDIGISFAWSLWIGVNWTIAAYSVNRWYLTLLVFFWWVFLFWAHRQMPETRKRFQSKQRPVMPANRATPPPADTE